jgi:endonuclease/exonuclease/phosphatase family metal-dependent hydrolase
MIKFSKSQDNLEKPENRDSFGQSFDFGEVLKLMSFNIRYGLADDGENHWERRKSLVVDRIKSFAPDLLGLQECRDDSQAAFIKANLQDYEFLGLPRGGDSVTAPEMAPILLKRSAFLIRQWETFWLSETPYVPGSKSWGSVFPRTVTWVDLVHAATGRPLVFVNTHFDYEPSAVQESARFLKDWIDEAIGEHPLLLCGDFNADKDSAAYRQLTSGNPLLKDILKSGSATKESEETFHGFGNEIQPSSIDWMLASGHFTVLHAGIDRHHEGGLFPSDHYPVLATLEWVAPS